MRAFHIGISIINLLCAGTALVGFIAHIPGLLALGVFFGYWANLAAVIVGLWVLLLISARAFSGGARELLSSHWLAVANGTVVVLAWVSFFAIGKLSTGGGAQ